MTVITSVKSRAKKEEHEARKSGDEGLDMDIPDEVSSPSLFEIPNALHTGDHPPLPEGHCKWRARR